MSYFDDGRPGEIFITGAKSGSGMDAVLADGAVAVSLALQHGVTPAELAKSLARLPDGLFGKATAPASPIGAAVDLLTEMSP